MSLPLTRLLRKLLHVAAKPMRHAQGKDGYAFTPIVATARIAKPF